MIGLQAESGAVLTNVVWKVWKKWLVIHENVFKISYIIASNEIFKT